LIYSFIFACRLLSKGCTFNARSHVEEVVAASVREKHLSFIEWLLKTTVKTAEVREIFLGSSFLHFLLSFSFLSSLFLSLRFGYLLY